MNEFILYGSVIVLIYYYLTHVLNKICKKWNWKWWYKNLYLNSFHWKFLRWRKKQEQLLFNRSNFCEKCGRENYLQIHHINYRRLGREWLSDLQIVCKFCHRQGSGRL